jgi:hypothetical protein
MGSISADTLLDRRAKLQTSLSGHQNTLQQLAQQRQTLDDHERRVYANLNAVQGALAVIDDLLGTLPPAATVEGAVPFPAPPAEVRPMIEAATDDSGGLGNPADDRPLPR